MNIYTLNIFPADSDTTHFQFDSKIKVFFDILMSYFHYGGQNGTLSKQEQWIRQRF